MSAITLHTLPPQPLRNQCNISKMIWDMARTPSPSLRHIQSIFSNNNITQVISHNTIPNNKWV